MGRKTKKYTVHNLQIQDITSDGKCLARDDNKVIFVKNVAPGDLVDVQVYKDKKNFAEASPINFISYSDKRTEPVCDHFGVCGGCKWQHVQYDTQLFYKEKQVKDAIERIAKVEKAEYLPILGAKDIYGYRNKLEFTFTPRRWLTDEEINSDASFEKKGVGFHVPGGFSKVIDVHKCHLQGDLSNSIRNELRVFALEHDLTFYNLHEHHGLLRNLVVRNTSTGEWMIIVQFGEDDKDGIDQIMTFLKDKFPEITSLNYVVNTKKNDTYQDLDVINFAGKEFIVEEMEGLNFRIGPKSFFQTNSNQALELYRLARNFADIQKDDIVYDLYTGTGTIANFVASKAKKVVGIEYVPEAIIDAKINSEENNISNTAFFAGDMKDLLTNEMFNEQGVPDVIITDPPRAGMHPDVIEQINFSGARKIVYVSCNPATQARDIELLSGKYDLIKIQPVDMFPQTHHVESVALLVLKD